MLLWDAATLASRSIYLDILYSKHTHTQHTANSPNCWWNELKLFLGGGVIRWCHNEWNVSTLSSCVCTKSFGPFGRLTKGLNGSESKLVARYTRIKWTWHFFSPPIWRVCVCEGTAHIASTEKDPNRWHKSGKALLFGQNGCSWYIILTYMSQSYGIGLKWNGRNGSAQFADDEQTMCEF